MGPPEENRFAGSYVQDAGKASIAHRTKHPVEFGTLRLPAGQFARQILPHDRCPAEAYSKAERGPRFRTVALHA